MAKRAAKGKPLPGTPGSGTSSATNNVTRLPGAPSTSATVNKPSYLESASSAVRDAALAKMQAVASGMAGGNSSTTSNSGSSKTTYTAGDYKIGSDAGIKQAESMGLGTNWYNPGDGSTWYKGYDGNVTVDHNGTRSTNAYTPSDYTTLWGQQKAAGVPGAYVQNTMDKRNNKALTTEGLENFAYDDTYWEMYDYVKGYNQKKNQEDSINQFMEFLQNYNQNSAKPTAPKRDSRIDALLDQILNRESFSYNAANDPLYQQYKEMYMREGDRAMRETIAEAVASAGGMNSYAMTAAQQANNYYNSQLNDKIPELYQLAYDMYLADKESQIQNLGILQDMDDTQYARYRDTMNDWYKDRSFAYGAYTDAVNQGNYLNELEYNSMWDKINFNSDNYRANKEWNANEEQKAKADAQDEQDRAREEVEYLLKNNVPLSALGEELIQKTGWTNEILKYMAEQYAPATSGGARLYSYPPTGPEGDGYTTTNRQGDDGDWVFVTDIGRLTWDELETMLKNKEVIASVDEQNKIITYKKA